MDPAEDFARGQSAPPSNTELLRRALEFRIAVQEARIAELTKALHSIAGMLHHELVTCPMTPEQAHAAQSAARALEYENRPLAIDHIRLEDSRGREAGVFHGHVETALNMFPPLFNNVTDIENVARAVIALAQKYAGPIPPYTVTTTTPESVTVSEPRQIENTEGTE